MIFAIRSVGVRRFPAAVVLLLLGFLTLSCSKKGGGGGTVAPPTTATATVTGVTLGSAGLPLANSTVSCTPSAGVTATSNSFGYFSLKVPANTPISITASHAGFADHPIPFQLATNENRALTIVLTPFGGTGSLTVSSGGKVTDNVGAFAQVRTSTRGGRPSTACIRCSGWTSGPQAIAWITRQGPR